MANGRLGFKYERKRIKRIKELPPLCPDYKSEGSSGNCEKAGVCKNATHSFEGQKWGICYGGTKSSEREKREKSLARAAK